MGGHHRALHAPDRSVDRGVGDHGSFTAFDAAVPRSRHFERTLQASIDDIATSLRINRLRELYVEMFPGLRDSIPTTVPSGGVASHARGDDRLVTGPAAALVFLATVTIHQRLQVVRKRPYLSAAA